MVSPKHRSAQVKRETRETKVELSLNLDKSEGSQIQTGVGFFDHMLDALSKHSRIGLQINAVGDLHVDQHHLVEDVGIALGTAFREALGDDLRIRRFSSAYAPLDEALARVVIDISGRPYLHFAVDISAKRVGEFDADLVEEFYRAFVTNAGINLHADLIHGSNAHHQIEALFKATALALRAAVEREDGLKDVPSTKGTLNEKAARK